MLLVEVNAAIAIAAASIGGEAQQVLDAFPRARSRDGHFLLMPRLALLATLCEHPRAVKPSLAQVDDWERRYAARTDPNVAEDEGARRAGARIVTASFGALRKRLA